MYFDDAAHAEEDWERLMACAGERTRAPRQYNGLHTDYANYDIWRIASVVRLAEAKLALSEGKDPCEDIRLKKSEVPDETRKAKLSKEFERYMTDAVHQIEHVVAKYNAFTYGTAIADILATMNKYTQWWDDNDDRYVMHKDYVNHVLNNRPYTVNDATIVRSGLYRIAPGRWLDQMNSEDSIAPELRQSYGIEYWIDAQPIMHMVPTKIVISRRLDGKPRDETLEKLQSVSFAQANNAFLWTFDKADELTPATWTFTLTVDPTGNKPVIVSKTFRVESARRSSS